ncbi:MAG: hypothetical protein WB771_00155 [Solirubrobacterales bacterium]
MPVFRAKARSWTTYVAGIGASGALMASAFVIFVILVGVLTFKFWPHAGGLPGGGSRDVALDDAAKPPVAQRSGTASDGTPARVPGGGRGSASSGRSDVVRGGSTGGGDGLTSGGSDRSPGPPSGGQPGGSGGGGQPARSGGGAQQAPQQPPSTPAQPRNVVSEAVSSVGNTVESNTESLGDTLGGSSGPGVGAVLGGVGRTVNNELQGLAGNH